MSAELSPGLQSRFSGSRPCKGALNGYLLFAGLLLHNAEILGNGEVGFRAGTDILDGVARGQLEDEAVRGDLE